MSGFSFGFDMSFGAGIDTELKATAFGPLKAKLISGASATIFVNADSTGHSEWGPFYKFAMALGDLFNATVIIYRWAEWGGSSANGPKAYADPVTLRSGSSQTITVYLASLPGQVAGCMFDEARKPAAIDAIPTPDVAITHHGHNMSTFETQGGLMAVGRGLYWSVIGQISWKWKDVPQVLTTQNPWRDTTGYDKLINSLKDVAAVFPSITIADSHKRFIDAGKISTLYRSGEPNPGVHPSDTQSNGSGAQLVADELMSVFLSTKPAPFVTVSWMELPIGTNLFVNGDLLNWPSTTPVNYTNVAGHVTSKDTDPLNIHPGAGMAYSARCKPADANGHFSKVQNSFDVAERASMAGKTVTAIMLAKANPLQRSPVTSFVTRAANNLRTLSGGGNLLFGAVSGAAGWMPIVYGGIPCDSVNDDANSNYSFSPAFGGAAAPTADVNWLQRAVIIEGSIPRLGLVRPEA